MHHIMFKLIQIPLLFGLFCPALALARKLNHREENEWTSTQKASLGNIGMLSENFTDQFFSDPSLVSRKKRSFDLQISSVNMYYTKDITTTTSEISNLQSEASSGSSQSGVGQAVELLDFVSGLSGRRMEGGLTMNLLALRIGNVSVIPYSNLFLKAHIDVPSWPEAEVILDSFTGVGVGYAHELGKNFDLGINLRPGARFMVAQELSASTIEVAGSSSGDESSEPDVFAPRAGFYIPLDLGFGWRVNERLRANLVARNAYGGVLADLSPQSGSGSATTAPPDYPLHLSLGGMWEVFNDKANRIRIASDLQDILGMEGFDQFLLRWQWAAQYLYSLSFRESTSFGLNVGLQSGYPSVGVLLDLFLARFEAAYFVFEGGAAAGQNPVEAYSFRLFSEISF